jgi:hypothetical protein
LIELPEKPRRCAKCNSADLVKVPGSVGAAGAGSNISVGWTIFSAVPVARIVCLTCGYVESWVEDWQDLEKLREQFSKP